MGAGGVIPAGSFYFCKDDGAAILLLGVAFMYKYRARIYKLIRIPGIDSMESIPCEKSSSAGIFKQSMGARNRAGIGLSYRNWFLGIDTGAP